MFTVYGIEYNHRIIYIGYRRYDSELELEEQNYIDYTTEVLYNNDGTYWEDIKNNKDLTQDNIIIFKIVDNIDSAIDVSNKLSYLILPKYNQIEADGSNIYYVFPNDYRKRVIEGTLTKEEEDKFFNEEDKKEKEEALPLSLEQEMLLLN